MRTITWDEAHEEDTNEWRTLADEADAFILSLEDESPGARLVPSEDAAPDPAWWALHGVTVRWHHDPARDGSGCSWCGAYAQVNSDNLCIECHDEEEFYYEGPTCSICDALGHGYPGGAPCPLEDRGYDDPRGY